jgi:alanine racemase
VLRVSSVTDLSAIARNCGVLNERSGSAQLCAVVKANGYGNAPLGGDGIAAVASAALRGGASWLAVAAAEEAVSLRAAGLSCRVLTMGTALTQDIDRLVSADCDLAVWSNEAVDQALRTAGATGGKARLHVKLDSGMGRLGTGDPAFAMELVERIAADPNAELAGVMTHFATADEDDDSFLLSQLARFSDFAAEAKSKAPGALAHAANSAATLKLPATHFDMVRCGIAVYGLDPFGSDPANQGLSPAIEWRSVIGRLSRFAPGDSAGYGRRFIAK